MKLWADGSNQAETAWQSQAYLNTDKRGTPSYKPDEMAALCQQAKDAGWTMLAHCQGDAAVFLKILASFNLNTQHTTHNTQHTTHNTQHIMLETNLFSKLASYEMRFKQFSTIKNPTHANKNL